MKLKFDWPAFITALRTAGAMMLGNVFVSAALLGNRNWLALGWLFFCGVGVMILTSTTRKD